MVKQHASARDGRPFHGVRMRSGRRWVSEIRIPDSRDKIWLGSYPSPEQAARAYDIASLLLCRPFPLNFADSPSLLNLPHLSAVSSRPTRRSIQTTAYLAARSSPGCATINPFHAAHEIGSTVCASVDYPHLQEDCSWMQEVRGLLAPEDSDTMNGAISTSNVGAAEALSIDHAVLDAAAINLSFDAVASCSAGGAASGELQEEVLTMILEDEVASCSAGAAAAAELEEEVLRMILEDQEHEEAFLEMITVDGFTATSATVTTRLDVMNIRDGGPGRPCNIR